MEWDVDERRKIVLGAGMSLDMLSKLHMTECEVRIQWMRSRDGENEVSCGCREIILGDIQYISPNRKQAEIGC